MHVCVHLPARFRVCMCMVLCPCVCVMHMCAHVCARVCVCACVCSWVCVCLRCSNCVCACVNAQCVDLLHVCVCRHTHEVHPHTHCINTLGGACMLCTSVLPLRRSLQGRDVHGLRVWGCLQRRGRKRRLKRPASKHVTVHASPELLNCKFAIASHLLFVPP
jgi:hypothetical protein